MKLGILVGISIWFMLCLPTNLFHDPTCTVIEDREGTLLGARIANDGQWRFPHNPYVPRKFDKCITEFEDRYFYQHPGVNPVSILRATMQNIKEKRIVSGGSTLTMQVIRLSRKGKGRTVLEKIVEMIWATRAEIRYTKKELLAFYSSNAPFGGNVVGLDAAAWRYFGTNPENLTWGESATLAVLPNAPSLIYPGKNHEKLLAKRNRLLDRLQVAGVIDTISCMLAKTEPLPQKPHSLPQGSPHLLARISKDGYEGQRVTTTIRLNLQERATQIIERHHTYLKGNEVHNAAAIIVKVETGEVVAYVGNTKGTGELEFGNQVDIITAPRSTGSIMKPFLFASMIKEGDILPNTLVPDIPTQIAGYSPKNYTLEYDGVVPAHRALARSLNIPAVRMAQDYGLEKIHYQLQKIGLSTITKPANHYGLSIILGGAEATLWDLTGVYSSMSRTLNHFRKLNSKYDPNDFRQAYYILKDTTITETSTGTEESAPLDAGSIWLTYKALIDVNRPTQESGWQQYSSSRKLAWKTGTSFGYRDAWAIGTTPEYVIGVWVGNADGEGRPGLTGLSAAAPILFDLFNIVKSTRNWFEMPYDELRKIAVCSQSGHRALDICEPIDSMYVHIAGLKTGPCPYHKLVHLNSSGKRVNSECADVNEMTHKAWFVLPPVQEWYYKSKSPSYRSLPSFAEDCAGDDGFRAMDLIYPKEFTKIYVPFELDGKSGKTIFEVAHRKANTTIYWHIDNEYLGKTTDIHEMGLNPKVGIHILTLVDEFGETLVQRFEIVGRNE